jgi:hypothetical protein
VPIVEKPFLGGQLTDCIRHTFDKHYGPSP